jgi:transcriptional regulator GlxA family with amidase domain
MSGELHRISNWPERAAEAQWCVNTLAVACGVSLPQLERHFNKTWGRCPRAWLQVERMRRACELLDRERINEIATRMGFGHHGNFTRAFTRHFGYPPSQHLKRMIAIAVPPFPPRPGGQGEVSSLESEIGN